MAYDLYQGQTLPSRRDVERALRKMAQEEGAMLPQLTLNGLQVIGRGVHRVAYLVDFKVKPDPIRISGADRVLLYPYAEEASELKERLYREATALELLSQIKTPFRIPKPVGGVEVDDAVILLERFVEGNPIDLRAGRCLAGKPWEVAGEIAAAVHMTDLEIAEQVGGFPTRREHALEAIKALDGHDQAWFKVAKEWCLKHLPPEDEPSALLHGDLSGQNILIDLKGGKAPALIDWTFTLWGDPAHEMAIITQGKRRPFEVDHGLHKLLEAYEDAGGRHIKPEEVYLHELCLFGRRYRAAKERGKARAEHPQEPLRALHGLLTRLGCRL